MNKPLISICIPMYNSENTIVRCIESICNQTYRNIEIILLDDGSTDKTCKICEELCSKDNRIKYKRFSNNGLACARNKLIKASSGEYISFIDSDDCVKKSYLDTLYGNIKKFRADISIINHKVCTEDSFMKDDAVKNGATVVLDRKEAIKELLLDKRIQNYMWGKLYKREVFVGVEFPEGHNYEDLACMYKIFLNANRIVYCDKTEYLYIANECGIVRKTKHRDYVDEIMFSYERFLNLKKIEGIEKENAYGFIIWFLRVYKYMKLDNDYDTQFLKDRWENVLEIMNVHGSYIYNQLSNEKRNILNKLLETSYASEI